MRRSDAAVDALRAQPALGTSGIARGGPPRHARHGTPPALLPHRHAGLRILVLGGLAVTLVAVLVALAHPLPAWCAAIAIAIRLAGSAQYTRAVVRRQARPNVVTWALWGITPLIAVAAQADERPGPEAAVTLVLGLGPLVVAAVAFCTDRSASHLTPFTLSCAAASLAGIVLWQVTAMPGLAIAFCILADLLATLPTLRKAYIDPDSEYAPPYVLSMLAMLVTLGTVENSGFTAYGFPLYMLLVNLVLFVFAAFPVAHLIGGHARRRAVVRRRSQTWCVPLTPSGASALAPVGPLPRTGFTVAD